jgi:hypothetical protein
MTLIILITIIVSYVLIGRFKGIADTIQHSEDYRLNGWKAKWKTNEEGIVIVKDGEMVEKFWGSSTIFVWRTDYWHLANFCQYRIQDAIAWGLIFQFTGSWWSLLAFIILPWLRYIGFKQTYRR